MEPKKHKSGKEKIAATTIGLDVDGLDHNLLDTPGVEQVPAAWMTRGPADGPASAPLFIREGRELCRIHLLDITHLRSDRNYVEVHVSRQRFVVRNSLEVIMKSLPKGLFVRINRSEAVNVLHVDLIGEDEVRIGRQSFSLSRRCRSEMLNQIQVIRSR